MRVTVYRYTQPLVVVFFFTASSHNEAFALSHALGCLRACENVRWRRLRTSAVTT